MELGGGGWNWVEVDAQFSNTHLKFCKTREILALTFLLWEIFRRHCFLKSVSIVLYDSKYIQKVAYSELKTFNIENL